MPKNVERYVGPLVIFNPITYEGGGFLARTIRLSTTTLKQLYLAPANLVTFCFLSIRHILAEF